MKTALLLLSLLVPDLLTSKLGALTEAQSHWVATKLGIFDGMHDWLRDFCPCLDGEE